MTKRVLITGSNGMLGKDMASVFDSKGYTVYGLNRNENNKSNLIQYICDLADTNKTKKVLKEIDPDIIINCAANINLDLCEVDKKDAYKINSEVSEMLASYKPLKTQYVYISTDSVFDGTIGNYKEEDKTNPLNYYAYTKLWGERLALNQNNNSIIIRTNIYGFSIPERKSLVEWAINSLKMNKELFGFTDVYFNPVYTKQLAEVCYELVRTKFTGVVNVGSKQSLSKYEFLLKLADVFGYEKNTINAILVEEANFSAKRPKITTLDIQKLENLISYDIDIEKGIEWLYHDYILRNRRGI